MRLEGWHATVFLAMLLLVVATIAVVTFLVLWKVLVRKWKGNDGQSRLQPRHPAKEVVGAETAPEKTHPDGSFDWVGRAGCGVDSTERQTDLGINGLVKGSRMRNVRSAVPMHDRDVRFRLPDPVVNTPDQHRAEDSWLSDTPEESP